MMTWWLIQIRLWRPWYVSLTHPYLHLSIFRPQLCYVLTKDALTNQQIRVGMSIGHHPSQTQHTPDMRKNAADITESDLADANRRIGGGETQGGGKTPVASMAG